MSKEIELFMEAIEETNKKMEEYVREMFLPFKDDHVSLTKNLQNLMKNDPNAFVENHIKLLSKCNNYIYENQALKQRINELLQSSAVSATVTLQIENENSRLEQEVARLNLENTRLQAQIAHLSQIKGRTGRPSVYDSEFRQRVIDFYNESSAHTYQVTAHQFNISTNTVSRILKENA